MCKFLTCAIFFVALQATIAQAMVDGTFDDGISHATIVKEIIPGATHYHLIRGGTPYDRGQSPVTVYQNPRAFFYQYDAKQKENIFLGKVPVLNLDPKTIQKLDAYIDPSVKFPVLTKVIIVQCIKRGRWLKFYDENDNEIDSCTHYKGPLDIKSEEHNTRLIKPHYLLQHLRVVEEVNPVWWKALIWPGYKETLKYD